MTNPINWGGTPLANAAIRGFIAALVTGVLTFLYRLQAADTLEQAAIAGTIPALLALLTLLGYGASDQQRVADRKVLPSDVPVQVAAKREGLEPVVVAGDWFTGEQSHAHPAADYQGSINRYGR
jgi:hypothetical protein